MKRIVKVLLIAVLLMSFVGCSGKKEGLADTLAKEQWCESEQGDAKLTFKTDGTGVFENSDMTFGFTWEKVEGKDDTIVMSYQWSENGKIYDETTDFVLAKEKGKYTLTPVGGVYVYIRVSDFKKK